MTHKIRVSIKTVQLFIIIITQQYIYIYIYASSRRFYPKQLPVHSGYTVLSVCVLAGNWTHKMFCC